MNHESGVPMLYPSFPQLKLFPEAAAASLGDNPEDLPLLILMYDKRARIANTGFSPQPVPLDHLYSKRPTQLLKSNRCCPRSRSCT